MPITISIPAQNVDASGRNFVYVIGTLTFTGSYATNGDTLDLTTVSEKLSSSQIVQIVADSINGNAMYYVAIVGNALNNHKLKVFSAGGTELAAGAYPVGVTGDTVQIRIIARKFQ
ncbi:MAG TPA: hypothetical protein VGJ06_18645 [Candidatus Acidoferrum sp.]|jgi:hypothetical protein